MAARHHRDEKTLLALVRANTTHTSLDTLSANDLENIEAVIEAQDDQGAGDDLPG